MPVSLPPLSKRHLLTGSLHANAGLLAEHLVSTLPDAEVDSGRFVLLSDLHINANPGYVEGGVNVTDSFCQVRAEILALKPQPAAILICGDIAHHWGKEA